MSERKERWTRLCSVSGHSLSLRCKGGCLDQTHPAQVTEQSKESEDNALALSSALEDTRLLIGVWCYFRDPFAVAEL